MQSNHVQRQQEYLQYDNDTSWPGQVIDASHAVEALRKVPGPTSQIDLSLRSGVQAAGHVHNHGQETRIRPQLFQVGLCLVLVVWIHVVLNTLRSPMHALTRYLRPPCSLEMF